ncbi:protein terminal ear1-like [Rosa chinensis]|uniref:protein terminal ear1-like n=1 Tax=Rosa chinensis TaxID=74649 RepID=UPI001AD910C0|nr:protein terminal ear1-like [Rosa chinensis]
MGFNHLALPMGRKIANLGYGFVNFTTAVGALGFYEKYHKTMWKKVIQSTKICEITCAKIQGFEALRKSFRRKIYHGLTNDFLPVILAPACDGVRESNHIPVGRLLGAAEIEN